jgi:hypothetical protein
MPVPAVRQRLSAAYPGLRPPMPYRQRGVESEVQRAARALAPSAAGGPVKRGEDQLAGTADHQPTSADSALIPLVARQAGDMHGCFPKDQTGAGFCR